MAFPVDLFIDISFSIDPVFMLITRAELCVKALYRTGLTEQAKDPYNITA